MIELVTDTEIEAPVAPETHDSFLGVLWRRRWVLLGMLLGSLAIGAVVHLLLPPAYESRAEILLVKQVSNSDDDNLTPGEVNIEDDLNTQMTIFRSVRVVSAAIEKHGLDQLSSFQTLDPETPIVTHIIDQLSAVRGGTREFPDPNVMHVAYEGPHAEDCEVVLEAVIESYQEFLGKTYQSFGRRALSQISAAKEVLDSKLQHRKEEYRQFRKNAPIMLRTDNGEEITVHQVRLADLEKRRAEVLQQISQIESSLREVESALARGVSSDAVSLMINRHQPQKLRSSSRASLRAQLEAQLIDAMVEEQQLFEFGSGHPDVVAARQRVELLEKRLSQIPEEEEPISSDEEIAVYIDALRHEVGMLRSQRDDLDRQFAREEAQVRTIREYLARDMEYRQDLDNRQKLFDTVLGQLETANLVKDYSGITAEVITTPETGEQVAPTIPKTGLIALAIGMLLGLATVWLLDVADQRFSSPQELRGHLGLPVLAHIPLMSKETRRYARLARAKLPHALDESLCTFYQPGAPISEAYRGLRTILHFNSKNNDNRVIQVTSAMPGDGKTTVAANLAICLAQSGKRVILVDSDLRMPRLGKLFGIESDLGTSAVLQGKCSLQEAIIPTPLKNLWLLPCGTPPANPSELLMSPAFKALLTKVRENGDIVIVDSPPMLPITDAALIAPLVDSVLLTVKLSHDARGMSRQAVEALREVNATVLGVVVNGVNTKGSNYRQQSSYYSYGYPARYGSNGTMRANGHAASSEVN